MNSSTITGPETATYTAKAANPLQLRHQRTKRIFSAWVTSAPSKVLTLVIQAVAVPIVYRSIGPTQFAAYAAVTASVSILSFLNLGMGGALVTPLAQAVADNDWNREASLVRSGIFPITALAIVGLAVALLSLSILPMRTVFGLVAAATSGRELRTAAILACVGTVVAVPLSVVESARQAYQELHVNNLLNALSNIILCLGLLFTAWLHATLKVFVAVTVFGPLFVRILNAALLFRGRPYLLAMHQPVAWLQARGLVRDGLSYTGAAAMASVLLYHWPVYYMARTRAPLESSQFAIFLQLIVFIIAFGASLALPLWRAIADSVARVDYPWIKKLILRARLAALAYGICWMVVIGLTANFDLGAWLHRPIHVDPEICWFGGFYVLLAMWENVHWPLALGLGAMRAASGAVFCRAVAFAIAVPLLISHGGAGVAAALCTSVITLTAWYQPVLLARTFAARCGGTKPQECQRIVASRHQATT